MKQLGALFKKWINFLVVVFSPAFLIVLVLTVFSVYFSIKLKDQNILSSFLTIIASILGGISGGLFYGEYNKGLDDNMLRKKGLSAVRNLKTIQEQASNLKKWIIGFIKSEKYKETDCLSEMNRHITTMEMNIVSGYEDWIDLVPQLSEAKEKMEEVKDMVEKIYEKKKKLTESKDKDEKEKLGKQISLLEKQVKLLKEKNNKTFSFPFSDSNSLVLSNIDSLGSIGNTPGIIRDSYSELGKLPHLNLTNKRKSFPNIDSSLLVDLDVNKKI